MSDHYTIISADTHAGGSHAQYRDYLEEKYLDDFDAWRGKYRNPFKDLGDDRRLRNWDNEMRTSQQLADGVVGEVMFPNTIPPFFPSFVLSAPPPKDDEYEHRLAGIRAHNRWLADFCADYPVQRAGIGQIFTHDLDDALADVQWVAEHGLRGGILIPNNPPDATWVEHQLYDPYWEPLWALCADLGVPVNAHGGTGVPNFGKVPAAQLLFIAEFAYFAQRPFLHLLMSGVFERHPKLTFVMTEMGAYWLPPLLRRLDLSIARIRDTGSNRRAAVRRGVDPAEGGQRVLPVELLRRHLVAEGARRRSDVGDRARPVHVGVRLPARRGHAAVHEGTPATAVRRLARATTCDASSPATPPASTASTSTRSAPLAEQWGPTVDEISKRFVDLPEDANEALVRGPVG